MLQMLHSLFTTHYKQLTNNKVTNEKKTLVLINDALYILNKLYYICYQIVTS